MKPFRTRHIRKKKFNIEDAVPVTIVSSLAFILLIVVFNVVLSYQDDTTINTIQGEVVNVEEVIKSSNGNIETIHYIHIKTEEGIEIFQSRDNFWQNKYNNMQIIMTCKEYKNKGIKTFMVSGKGKSLFYPYRNIIKVF